MTVKEIAATLNREAADSLSRAFQAMPADKQAWRPLNEGRSAWDQVVECGIVNRMMAEVLDQRTLDGLDRTRFERAKAEKDTAEKALSALGAGTDALIQAIQGFPEERLDEVVVLPLWGGVQKSFGQIMFIPYWNMSYHLGQTNYVQTLYGDRQRH